MIYRRHILTVFLSILLWGLMGAGVLAGETFDDFFINFVYHPERQGSKVMSGYTIDNRKVAKRASYFDYANRQLIGVVCADSLSGATVGLQKVNVSLLGTANRQGFSYQFVKNGSSYRLLSAHLVNGVKAADADFLSFLTEYSTNRDFQMKRTIFPFPLRYFSGNKEVDSKLVMPREWSYLDFSTQLPQLCVLENSQDKTNRRIYVYSASKLSRIYNFIYINRKWFLIEVENY